MLMLSVQHTTEIDLSNHNMSGCYISNLGLFGSMQDLIDNSKFSCLVSTCLCSYTVESQTNFVFDFVVVAVEYY